MFDEALSSYKLAGCQDRDAFCWIGNKDRAIKLVLLLPFRAGDGRGHGLPSSRRMILKSGLREAVRPIKPLQLVRWDQWSEGVQLCHRERWKGILTPQLSSKRRWCPYHPYRWREANAAGESKPAQAPNLENLENIPIRPIKYLTSKAGKWLNQIQPHTFSVATMFIFLFLYLFLHRVPFEKESFPRFWYTDNYGERITQKRWPGNRDVDRKIIIQYNETRTDV